MSKKDIIVHGDGTSLCTLTHSKDFALELVGFIGNPKSIGETYHITNNKWLTWNNIYNISKKFN